LPGFLAGAGFLFSPSRLAIDLGGALNPPFARDIIFSLLRQKTISGSANSRAYFMCIL
jgi:hypothetical protein